VAWRSPSRPSSRRCGRRAGLRLGIAAGPDGAFLAHPDLEAPLLVDPAAGAVRDAGTLDQAVSWQCCHQVAARILNRIGERADRVGNVVWALRAPSCASRCRSTGRRASACSSTCGACAPG
jgi:hypothetical protein